MDNEGMLPSAKQPDISECLTVIEANFAFSAGIRKFLNNRHFPYVVLSKAVDTRTQIQRLNELRIVRTDTGRIGIHPNFWWLIELG